MFYTEERHSWPYFSARRRLASTVSTAIILTYLVQGYESHMIDT
jgi:hypothetical protein